MRTAGIARRFLLFVLVLLVLLISPGRALCADTPEQMGGSDAASIRIDLAQKEAAALLGSEPWSLEEVDKRIGALKRTSQSAGPPPKGESETARVQREAYEKSTARLLDLYTAYRTFLLGSDEDEPDATTHEVRPDPPYTIEYYDEIRYERGRLKKRLEDSASLLKVRTDELKTRIDILKKQQDKRKTTQAERTKSDEAEWRYQLASTEHEIDMVMLAISSVRLDVEIEYNRYIQKEYAATEGYLGEIRADILFAAGDLTRIEKNIAETIRAREAELELTTEKLDKLTAAAAVSGEPHPAALDARQRRTEIYRAAGTSLYAAEYALLTAQTMTERFKAYTLGNEISILTSSSSMWRNRYAVMHGAATGETFWRVRAEARIAVQDMEREEQYIYRSIEDFQTNMAIIGDQLRRRLDGGGAPQDAVLRELIRIFAELEVETNAKIGRTIREHRALAQAVLEETTERADSLRLAQRIEINLTAAFRAFMARAIWRDEDFELTAYDITKAIATVLAGFFISLMAASVAERIARKKLVRGKALTATIRRVTFYLIWLSFFMLALDSVNVPLTAFAFLGGTVALAVGFGAQDICRNLISGLILLVSRPFKRGDVVDIDNLTGTVEELGARSTLIRTFTGVEVFVPNSYFIANKVVNQTKSGPFIRQEITILVSSVSDPQKVEDILYAVIQDYKNHRLGSKPFVSLRDISRDALTFKIYYWLDILDNNSIIVAGTLRKEILTHFAQNDIELYQPTIYKNG